MIDLSISLITADNVAKILNISPNAVRTLAKQRDNPLKAIRIGSQFRFDPKDIMDFIDRAKEGQHSDE